MAKRRRIRWDRVIISAAILIAMIFLLGSCIHSCTRRSAEESSSGSPLEPLGSGTGTQLSDTQTSRSETTSTTPALPADYEEKSFSAADIYKGTLVLVNAQNPSHLSREELDLAQVVYASDRPDGAYQLSYPAYTFLNRTALTQFNRLMTAFYSVTQNTDILFNYGYLESGKEKANPDSPTGLSLQLHLHNQTTGSFGYITNASPYSWIYEHMDSYGFVVRYPEDKSGETGEKGGFSAIRYVGVPHAAYMAQNNLCLEEYLDLLKNSYSFGQGMLEFTAAEQKYRIYYVPASKTGETAVPVPTGLAYEVSGNNEDGFVVTVFLK